MSHELLVDLPLLVIIAVALFDFGNVGVKEQGFIYGDVLAHTLLDLDDREWVVQVLG